MRQDANSAVDRYGFIFEKKYEHVVKYKYPYLEKFLKEVKMNIPYQNVLSFIFFLVQNIVHYHIACRTTSWQIVVVLLRK